jgi:hypothetical protein
VRVAGNSDPGCVPELNVGGGGGGGGGISGFMSDDARTRGVSSMSRFRSAPDRGPNVGPGKRKRS